MSKSDPGTRHGLRFTPDLVPLEDRTVPAGNVTAFVNDGILHLIGDDAGNQVYVGPVGNRGAFVASFDGTTTINGQLGPVTFDRVNRGLDARLGAGDDVLGVAGLEVRRFLHIDTGSGADGVVLFDVVARRGTVISTGDGNDAVTILGSKLRRDAVIDAGGGDDRVSIGGTRLGRDVVVSGGGGFDMLGTHGVTFPNRPLVTQFEVILPVLLPPAATGTSTPESPVTPPPTPAPVGTVSVVLSSTASDPTNVNPIPFTATFDTGVQFDVSGLRVTNGTVTGFTAVSDRVYTFGVRPSGEGAVAARVAAGVARDAAGNTNTASNTLTRQFDSVAPVVTANALTTNAPTPTLTGTVDDAAAPVTVTVGGQTIQASVSGNTWSAPVPTALADGTYAVEVSATDAAGNRGSASLSNGLVIDTVGPSVTVDTSARNPTRAVANPYTVTFSENVTGFSEASLSVTNGTVSNFAAVDGRTYTLDVTPTADGPVVVTVPSGVATDPAGNGNTEGSHTLTADTSPPSATLTSTATSPTNLAAIPVTVTFSEDVTGFTAAGLVVTNGAVSNFVAVDARTYTLEVAPAADGVVTVGVATDAAQDAAGNSNALSATFNVVSDRTAPTVELSADPADPTNATPILVTATFGEAVTGFEASDVTVTNGSVIDFVSVNGLTYTFGVVPAGSGVVTVVVPAGSATDAAGNGNAASDALSRTFDGTVATPTITSSATDPTNLAAIPVTVTFSEDVTGFNATDLTVGNGLVSNFVSVNGTTYTFDVAPETDGTVTVDIAAGVAADLAGNPTAAATQFSITSDRTAPTATVTGTSPTNANPIVFTVTFSEPVTGLPMGALAATFGTVDTVTPVDERTFTVTVTPPMGDATVILTVLSGGVQDLAGNATATDFSGSVVSDRTAPTATLSTAEPDPTNASPIPFTVAFSEDITGFDANGLTASNGVVSNFTPVDARTYTFDVTPDGDGLVTVNVLAGVATDAAGNANTGDTYTITSERFAPTAVVTSAAAPATNVSPIPFTVTFSEDVTGFSDAGLDVTNGVVSNFTPVDARTYTFDVTPDTEGAVIVSVQAGAAQDAATNPNEASDPLQVLYDVTPPAAPAIAGLTAATDTGASDADGVTAVPAPTIAGTAEPLSVVDVFADSGSGAVSLGTTTADAAGDWRFTPPGPLADGTYTVTATARDAAGNTGPESGPFTLVIDTTAPVPTVTPAVTGPTNAATVMFTVTFDEDVTGFGESGLSVADGVVSNFTPVDARTYTFDVTPDGDGPVNVTVLAGEGQDLAGNGNVTASGGFTSDRTAPVAVVAAASPTNADPIVFTVTFDEAVTDLMAAGLEADGGTVATITRIDDRTFTVEVTPAMDGPVTLRVLAGAVQDDATNTNAQSEFTATSDRTGPTATISPTGLGAITGTTSDALAGVTEVAVSIFDGTAYWSGTAFDSADEVFFTAETTNGWADWSFAFADGVYTVRARATDAAGNETFVSEEVTISS